MIVWLFGVFFPCHAAAPDANALALDVTVDLAEEAELLFRRGLEAYRARRYTDALVYLLASNRIVPNRIVVFDLARTYEEMGRLEAAWRYYSWYVALEPDIEEQTDAKLALARITPKVARLSVQTDPPGAAVYLDGRALGRRGSTPMVLALPAGTHHVILEHPSGAPVEIDTDLETGQLTELALTLPAELTPPVALPTITLTISGGETRLVDLDSLQCRVLGTEAVLGTEIPGELWPGSAWAAQEPVAEGMLSLDLVSDSGRVLRTVFPPLSKRSLQLAAPGPLHTLLFSRCTPTDPAQISTALSGLPKESRRAAVALFGEWAAWRGAKDISPAALSCANKARCSDLSEQLTKP